VVLYLLSFFVFALAERKNEKPGTLWVNRKYHAAVYPEPACLEPVEGSKGRQ